ncbi:MAG: sucB [Ornithinibacter sp.]|jgi:2-oxoglutarate dehydrogenase E2 component (dihydrolipoamide succinyltransferase)|nr:sucB [Ornithinibacter sp.]
MSERVKMPALGESVTEGTVTRWLKDVGDSVEVDEPLLEVSTDKVDTEIPSPVAGTLQEILVQVDDTVPVGADLAVVGDGAAGAAGGGVEQGAGQSADASGPADAVGDPADGNAVAQAGDEGGQEPAEPQLTDDDGSNEPQAASDQPAGGAPIEAQDSAPEQPAPTGDQGSEATAGAGATTASSGAGSGGSGSGDGTTVKMPALGESVTEGTITRWLKAEGDEVAVDEPLLEVSTDKVDTEIPSPVAGTLTSILVQEDETVPVGADLAVVGGTGGAGGGGDGGAQAAAAPSQESAEQAPPEQEVAPADRASQQPAAPAAQEPSPAAQEPAPAAQVTSAAPQSETSPSAESGPAKPEASVEAPAQAVPDRAAAAADGTATAAAVTQAPAPAGGPSTSVAGSTEGPAGSDEDASDRDAAAYVTPLVRKLAADHGIDLATVTGTGIGGRIRKQDVLDAAEAAKAPEPAAPAPASAPAPQGPGVASPTAAATTTDGSKRGTTEKMSRLRKTIARRMVESLQVSAQLTTVVEVDVTRISRLRDRAKADFAQREGTKLSFLPFFALAAVEALKAHPTVNASIDDDTVTYHGTEHLGMAVDTEKGLLVPVIKNAGDLNIAGLAKAIADVAERTRSNKIMPDDLAGGTFTVTNTGSRGALFDTPIINQPQVAILGTGAVVKRPVVVIAEDGGETIAIRSMVYLALSYDHRIVDGADAARFLSTMKQRLEEGAFEADLGL